MDQPLVSIGVPVRNGAATLAYILDAHLQQTYTNLEVVVSDNASTDATPTIIREFEQRDKRIRSLRHGRKISMWQNHAATFAESRGDYFVISSDNDLPSKNYVEVLLNELEGDESIGTAYARIEVLKDFTYSDLTGTSPFIIDYDTRGMPIWRRLVSDFGSGYPTHGMFRSAHLKDFQWWDHSVSPDWPLMTYMAVRSEIVPVQSTVLFKPPQPSKSGEERAAAQSYSGIESFPTARLSWRCAAASRAAARARGSRRFKVIDACLIFVGLLWLQRRNILRWAWEQQVLRRRGPRSG